MVKIANRRSRLMERAKHLGLYVSTYGPGDGVTRYRFFKSRKPVSYFSADGIYTALGLAEAEAYLSGYSRRR